MNQSEKLQNAMKKGRFAFHQGLTETENPYPYIKCMESSTGEYDSIEGMETEHFAWSVGYRQARGYQNYAESIKREMGY
jgi:hypothetical protein